MGVNYMFIKIKDTKLKSNFDLENYWSEEDKETVLYDYRKHYWISNFLRKNSTYGKNYDDFILEKDDILKFIEEIEFALNNDCSNFDKDDFFLKENVEFELNNVLEDMNELILEDFDNNTIYFSAL